VLIRLREHAFFRREGDDLVHVLRISPAQAALGADLEVPTIEGAVAAVKVPGGAQHGQMVRLRSKGVPHLGSSGRGDQLVYLDVAIRARSQRSRKRSTGSCTTSKAAPEQHDEGDARNVFDRIKDAIGGE
jgi:molecular chaperone DnaJ